MREGVKPLIDRLRNELQGTTIDPEAVIDIFIEWGDKMIEKRHVYDSDATWSTLKLLMKDNE